MSNYRYVSHDPRELKKIILKSLCGSNNFCKSSSSISAYVLDNWKTALDMKAGILCEMVEDILNNDTDFSYNEGSDTWSVSQEYLDWLQFPSYLVLVSVDSDKDGKAVSVNRLYRIKSGIPITENWQTVMEEWSMESIMDHLEYMELYEPGTVLSGECVVVTVEE